MDLPEDDFENLPESDARTRLARVMEVPLFPLELVLFPYMILPLHIFEERYKEMVNRCVHESLPFGIVLVSGVNAATGIVETHSVGCTARIQRVERLPDGRMNIEVIGEERFQILDTHEQHSYRSALIEPYNDDPDDDELLRMTTVTEEVTYVLKEFLVKTLTMHGQEIGDFGLPDDAQHLSFIAGCVLPVSLEMKQSLLVKRNLGERLSTELEVLREALVQIGDVVEAEEAPLIWKPLDAHAYDDYLHYN